MRLRLSGLWLSLAVVILALGVTADALADNGRRAITVALPDDLAPYAFRTGDGELHGIAKDLWDLWAMRTGTKVAYVATSWAQAGKWLLEGRIDAIGALPQVNDRKADMDFSPPFIPVAMQVYYRVGAVKDINTPSDLEGHVVGAVAAGRCKDWLAAHDISTRVFPTFTQMDDSVATGKIDVICGSRTVTLQESLSIRGVKDQFRRSPQLFDSHYHWAVRKGDPVFAVIADGFAKVSDSERQAVIRSWNGTLPATERAFIRQPAYLSAAGVLVLLAVLVISRLRRPAAFSRRSGRRDLERTLRALIGNLPGDIFRLHYDADGNKRFLFLDGRIARTAPEHHRRLLSMSAAEIRGCCHPEDHERLFVDVPRQLRETGHSQQVFRFAGPDSQWRWVRSWETLVSRNGDELISEGLAVDVTPQMLTNQALAERTSQLGNVREQLAEARPLATLGRMAEGIAHDFNNILGAILGFATFIAEDAPHDQLRGYATRIMGASRRGHRMVDRILTLSGRTRVTPSRITVGDLIAEVVAALDPLPPAIRLIADGAGSAMVIEADRAQLAQALRDLCDNATAALADRYGTIAITAQPPRVDAPVIRLAERDGPDTAWVVEVGHHGGEFYAATGALPPTLNRCVAITVSDTGTGMDGEVLSQAFAPFFTTGDMAIRPGLGLPIVQGVAVAHGGAVIVRSRPGHGTAVDLILPGIQ